MVEKVAFEAPKTKQLATLLGSLGLDGAKVLVLTNGTNRNAWLSSRNMPSVHVMPYAEVSAYDVIWSDALVVEEGAITGVEPEIAPEPAAKAPKAKAVKAKAVKAAKAEARATKKSAKKAAKAPAKKAAKKAAAKPAKKSPKKGK